MRPSFFNALCRSGILARARNWRPVRIVSAGSSCTMPACRRILGVLALCMIVASCSTASNNSAADLQSGTATGTVAYKDLQIVPRLPPPPNTNQGADDLIAENDLLEIQVFQVDELNRTVRVDSNGRINLALIGYVDAKGKTIPQLEAEIEKRYGAKYLQHPDVTVFMKESAGQRVTIDGKVRTPGIYPVSSTSTLMQVIAQAGGFGDTADESKIYVFRDFNGKKLVANYNVARIREGKQPDPRIYGGDVIISFESGTKVAAQNLRQALGIASSATFLATTF